MSEYWIVDGDLIEADGDFNSPDHEMYVISHIFENIANSLINSDSPEANKIGEIIENYLQEDAFRINPTEIEEKISEKFRINDICEYISKHGPYDYNTTAMAFGDRREDPRLWTCKNLGWIRVIDDNIESWGVKPSMLKRAAWALYEIDEDPSRVWNWENRRNGRVLYLTTEQIENGMISESIVNRIAKMIHEDPDIVGKI